jgi:hypothetical protein
MMEARLRIVTASLALMLVAATLATASPVGAQVIPTMPPSPLPAYPPPRTGVIAPVSPVAPQVQPTTPDPSPQIAPEIRPGGGAARYNSPICQLTPGSQSADLRAYCRTLGP